MKIATGALALAACLVAGQAFAQTNYTVSQTGDYASITNFTNCTTAPTYPCASFTSSMGVSGAFSFAAPLAPNLSNAEVGSLVTTFSFSGGLTTIANTDALARLNTLRVSTNAQGGITVIDHMQAVQWQGAGSASNRFDAVVIIGALGISIHNAGCQTKGTGNSGVTDTCLISDTPDTSRSNANNAPISVTTITPTPVPTLTEWAMILFGLTLAGGAALFINRRRFA